MKVLLLSMSDLEGGAARAAYRLHQGLQQQNLDSRLLVQKKLGDDPGVMGPTSNFRKGLALTRPLLDTLPLKFYGDREKTTFSPGWLPDRLLPKVAAVHPDLINLHWLGYGLLRIETLARLRQPLVWTLHDMWAFTGGCHYNGGCDRYQQHCGSCPQLGSRGDWDLSRWVWKRKASVWKQLRLVAVSPSQWLADSARGSSLLKDHRVEVIPNGIDLEKYKPLDRAVARKILNLPIDRHLILFGAVLATGDRRKGFHLLQPALHQLRQAGWGERAELVIFGATKPENPPDLGLRTHYLGRLNDDISLALAYAAADVFVAPSTQDNLPNTVLEAIACGTPCVAFNIGGMGDLIRHQHNGYLAQPFDIGDLANGIAWILADPQRHQHLSLAARTIAAQHFSLEIQAKRYLVLFEEILSNPVTSTAAC